MLIAFATVIQSLVWSLTLYKPCNYIAKEEYLKDTDFYPDPGYRLKTVFGMGVFGASLVTPVLAVSGVLLWYVWEQGVNGHACMLLLAVTVDAVVAVLCVGIPMAVTVTADLPSVFNATQIFPAGDKCAVLYIRDGWHDCGVLIVLQAFLLPVLCALLVLLPYTVMWLSRRCSGGRERMRQVWQRAILKLNVKLGPTAAAADDQPDYDCSAI